MNSSKYKTVISVLIVLPFFAVDLIFHKLSFRAETLREKEWKQEAVLNALSPGQHEERYREIDVDFEEEIIVDTQNNQLCYKLSNTKDDSPLAFDISARGINGEVKAILAVDKKKEMIQGVRVYAGAEIPGYGPEYLHSEDWMKKLRDQPLFPPSFKTEHKRRSKSVDGISGASSSLKAAFRFSEFFATSISRFIGGGKNLVPLELDLGVDAVTKATPGYPVGQRKPPYLRREIRRPAFMIPPETKLLSGEKPVTSSMGAEPVIGDLEQITDGIKTSTEFDYVELDPGPQWVQIDLEQPDTIYLVIVWHYYRNPVIYEDVIVRLSNDERFKRNVKTIYNNDIDNSSGEGAGSDSAYYARWWGEFADARGPSFKGTEARYVRVYTDGGTNMEPTRFVEVEVYGK